MIQRSYHRQPSAADLDMDWRKRDSEEDKRQVCPLKSITSVLALFGENLNFSITAWLIRVVC